MVDVPLSLEVQVYNIIVISSSYDRLVHDQSYTICRGNNPTSPVLTLAHAKSRLPRANSRLTQSMSQLTRANKYIETPVQVPPSAAVSVEIVRDGKKTCCLRREVRLTATLLLRRLFFYLLLLCRLLRLFHLKRLFVKVPIASADLPFVRTTSRSTSAYPSETLLSRSAS